MKHQFLTCDLGHKHMGYVWYNICHLEVSIHVKMKPSCNKNIQVAWNSAISWV